MDTNQFDNQLEIAVIKYIVKNNDLALSKTLDNAWFNNTKVKTVLNIWNKQNAISEVVLRQQLSVKNVEYDADYKDFYHGTLSDRFDFHSAIKILQEKFLQRKADEKLDSIRKIIWEQPITHIASDLIEFFAPMLQTSEKGRKLTDNIETADISIFDLGGKYRPDLNKILPIKKSLTVIGGESGFHKSNNTLNMILSFLLANPGKKAKFLSGEMDFEEVRSRIIAALLHLDFERVIRRRYDMAEIEEKLEKDFKHVIDGLIIVSPDDLNSKSDITKEIIADDCDVWGMDFLQWLAQKFAGNNAGEQNRNVMELIAHSKMLTLLTNTFGIVISQIKKKSEQRLTHFPRIDDLEWSGLTRQIAHNVVMCFWPWQIDKGTPMNHYISSWQKVRNGRPFTECQLVYPEQSRFEVVTSDILKQEFKPYLKK